MVTTHLSDAIAICEQALTREMNISEACQRLGHILQGMGKFQEAVVWHTYALQQQPKLATVYADLGKLQASQQQWPQAIALCERALQLDPDNPELCRHLASLYGRVGQQAEAALYRYRAVTLNPRWANPKNQLILGNTLFAEGKLEEAIDCYQRGIQLRPDFYEAYYNLGVALAEQEQWHGAHAAFIQALEINPDHGASCYGLGKLAERQGNTAEALSYYQRATALDPNAADAHYALGTVLLNLRQWQTAEDVCRHAVKLNPSFSWTYHNLGYVLLKLNRWQESAIVLRQAIALNPDSAWSYYHLGSALSRQALSREAALDQTLPHQLAHLWQEAVTAFLSAIQLQSDLAGVYTQLGRALRHQLQAAGREATLQFCQSIQLGHSGYAQVARDLAQVQQFDGAIVFWDLALSARSHLANLAQKHLTESEIALQQQQAQAMAGKQQMDATIANHRLEIQQQPNADWLYTHLGNLLADQGETEEAIALHRQAGQIRGWHYAADRHYQFTHDWFTYNISVWATHLEPLAHSPQVRALEVGSFEGMSACWLLDHILTHPLSTLTCIDLYFQEAFEFNVVQTGAGDRVTQLTGDSHKVLATLVPETYDIVYIDGCHLASHVQIDAQLSWKLLKAGGVLIFDDYQWTDPNYPGQDTQLGIDAFINSVGNQATIVHQGYQIIIQKLRKPHLFRESVTSLEEYRSRRI
ncbi:MAG TPA: tetratricopeptide repeat protein [Coleofasciculaceae cyanobacterium]|jgi:tetratricopeptide (TPR) repeat protein/predicted O-methyltransferase YrrM